MSAVFPLRLTNENKELLFTDGRLGPRYAAFRDYIVLQWAIRRSQLCSDASLSDADLFDDAVSRIVSRYP